MKFLKGISWLSFLLVLLPLGVDHALSLRLGHYDLRMTYLGAVIAGLLALFTRFRESLSRTTPISWAGLAVMCSASVMGWKFVSENPNRTFVFILWSLGTYAGMPAIVNFFKTKLGTHAKRGLIAYFILYAVIVICDSFLCLFSRGDWHIGNVIYKHTGFVYQHCRAFGWYQEPNYYAAFGTLGLFWLSRQKKYWIAGLVALSIILSGSRLGWLTTSIWVLTEISVLWSWIRSKKVWAAVAALGIAILSWLWVPGAIELGLKSFKGSSQIHGGWERYENFRATWLVFESHPWFGVGPGSAGAYLEKNYPNNEYYLSLDEIKKPAISHDPLSYSLYGEVLSEWGVVGAIGFLLYWFGFLRLLKRQSLYRLAPLLLLIGVSWQTLPRFDLLWMLFHVIEDERTA